METQIQITSVIPNKSISFNRIIDGKSEEVKIKIDEPPSMMLVTAIDMLIAPVCELGWLGDGWNGDIAVKRVTFKWAETEFSASTTIAQSTPKEALQSFTLRTIAADRLHEPDHARYLSALENVIADATDYVIGVRELPSKNADSEEV
jgi:hypothetical protein